MPAVLDFIALMLALIVLFFLPQILLSLAILMSRLLPRGRVLVCLVRAEAIRSYLVALYRAILALLLLVIMMRFLHGLR